MSAIIIYCNILEYIQLNLKTGFRISLVKGMVGISLIKGPFCSVFGPCSAPCLACVLLRVCPVFCVFDEGFAGLQGREKGINSPE